jgi:symplekin
MVPISIFCTLIRGVIERTDGKERENLLRRLYLESPIITEDAIELLKSFITIMGSAIVIVNLMKDLVMRRPTKKLNCLNFLLEFCYHDLPDVRKTAISTVLQLHAEKDFHTMYVFITCFHES